MEIIGFIVKLAAAIYLLMLEIKFEIPTREIESDV